MWFGCIVAAGRNTMYCVQSKRQSVAACWRVMTLIPSRIGSCGVCGHLIEANSRCQQTRLSWMLGHLNSDVLFVDFVNEFGL